MATKLPFSSSLGTGLPTKNSVSTSVGSLQNNVGNPIINTIKSVNSKPINTSPAQQTQQTAASNFNAFTANAAPLPQTAFFGSNTQKPKTTSVVSSKPAATQATSIKNTADTAQSQIVQNNANMDAQTQIDQQNQQQQNTTTGAMTPTGGSATTNTSTSAEDKILNAPDDGMQEAYNVTNGQRDDQPIGQLPPGYSTQNPQTRTDVNNTVDAGGGIQYKQFSDGTYGRFNLSTGTYSQASASDFADAKAVSDATTALTNLKNGLLTPSQQSQINAVTGAFQNLITQTGNQFNDNTKGALSILMTPGAVGINPEAIGNITKLANNAATVIAQAQVDMTKQVADMQQAFEQDDVQALKDAYDQYNTDQGNVQNNLDFVQKELDTQQAKVDSANSSIAVAMAKKYSDTSTPILPTDTPDQVQAKLATSPRWQQDQQVAEQLSSDETNFWASMALSGAGQDIILPSIGIGQAAANTKVQILKSIADNAAKLGLSAQDVANSVLDKTAKAKTYTTLQKNGALLANQEQKVESDFDLVKSLGAKVPDSVIQTGIPLLQQWINTGVLASTNNAALNNWLGALTTSLTNYARVVYGQTGSAGVTQGANTEVQNLLKSGLSVDTVNSYIDNTAIPEMNNTVSSFSQSMKQIQDDLNLADGTVGTSTLGVGNPGSSSGSTSASSGSANQGWDWATQ